MLTLCPHDETFFYGIFRNVVTTPYKHRRPLTSLIFVRNSHFPARSRILNHGSIAKELPGDWWCSGEQGYDRPSSRLGSRIGVVTGFSLAAGDVEFAPEGPGPPERIAGQGGVEAADRDRRLQRRDDPAGDEQVSHLSS